MNWRWNARRIFVSTFLILHLGAVAVVNMPASPLRQALILPVVWYLLPLGLDQAWGMFAPNPVMHTNTLEVLTVDGRGIQRTFAFPKMADFSIWEAMPRVRHSKYTTNNSNENNLALRECSVRHAIRELNIPADAFPVTAELYYQVIETPPVGEPARDPMRPPTHQTLQTYRFPTLAEVTP